MVFTKICDKYFERVHAHLSLCGLGPNFDEFLEMNSMMYSRVEKLRRFLFGHYKVDIDARINMVLAAVRSVSADL